jgi:hypothetical protein
MQEVDVLFAAAIAAGPVLGFATGRLSVLVAPLVLIPVLYLGTDRGWWGSGLGDAWQVGMILVLALALALTALAVVVRLALRRT